METPTLVFFAIWAAEDASSPFFSTVDMAEGAEGVTLSLELNVQYRCSFQDWSLSHISDALTL